MGDSSYGKLQWTPLKSESLKSLVLCDMSIDGYGSNVLSLPCLSKDYMLPFVLGVRIVQIAIG